ncbi:YceD family protein [Rhodophyticola sp. SM2404]
MTDPTPSPLPQEILRLAELPKGATRSFEIVPPPPVLRTISEELGITGLRKLRFEGEILPEGKRDWRLEAKLGATVTQPCVVSLEPVTTRIDTPILRRYLSEMDEPDLEEVEMPEDDLSEPLPATLDLVEVMVEALALHLPLYPRADGIEPAQIEAIPPGAKPITEETVKPFAGLAGLRDKLGSSDQNDDEN